MKKFYFLLLGLFLFTTANAQIINFIDPNFKAKLLAADVSNEIAKDLAGNYFKIDANSNGEIEVSEASQVSNLNLNYSSDSSIASIFYLGGILNFNNLQYLSCYGNNLGSLDVRGLTNLIGLACSNNRLTSLDVSGLTNLTTLGCGRNQLTSLNVSGLTNLTKLNCLSNKITSLNVSGLTNLTELTCYTNQLTSLDVSDLTNLTELICYQNQLTSLDLNGLTNLKELDCRSNQLISLNVSGLTNLTNLSCSQNQLTLLDINGLTNLKYLDCYNNQITSLDASNLTNLIGLQCNENQLTSLKISNLTNLQLLSCNDNQLPSLDASGLTNLTRFYCYNNQLISLELNGLINLWDLDCSKNQLTSLDVSGLINLIYLSCYQNQLTSLDASGLINLTSLGCNQNQLTSLEVNGLTNLIELWCYNNQLTSLDVSGLINLIDLDFASNQLTSLDVSDLTNLQILWCGDNLLSSIDVTGLMAFKELNCNDSSLLEFISIKNGSNESTLNFENNPNLQYICADDNQIIQIQDLISSYGYTNCHVNTYCSFVPGGNFYTIQGNNRYDIDNNGCDATDINYPNLKLSFSDGTNSGSLITNSTGNYHYDVQAGTHTITPVLENSNYFNAVTPTSTTVTFPTQSSPFTQDFCITVNGVHPDLEITLLPTSPARPGFDTDYKIIYKNKGTTTQSGSVNLTFDDAVLDFVTANPSTTTQTSNNLSWDYTNLLPFETREIALTLKVNAPTDTPAVNNGDILDFTATVTSPATDETPADNTIAFHQTVVGSYDPNDKTCLEGTTIAPEMVGEYVHYVIRFENTGTYPAENIVVKDMIDFAKFDINTLIPIKGSHDFVTKISDNNKVEFIFENINLPFDNATNDGFVAFKIKTKSSLVLGDTFTNSANIYFDYNFPIVTDPATTTVQALGKQDFEFADYFTLYPNPASSTLNLSTKSGITINSIAIYNTLGQLVIAVPNAQSVSNIDVSGLKTGNYFIKMATDKGSSNTKFLKN